MPGIDGALLRVLRTKDGWGLSALAREVGVSRQRLCDVEQGREDLSRSPGLVKKLAEALNVPVSMLERREVS